MKITERQLHVLLDTLSGSCSLFDRVDSPLFKYDVETRQAIYNEIINQNNDEVEIIRE